MSKLIICKYFLANCLILKVLFAILGNLLIIFWENFKIFNFFGNFTRGAVVFGVLDHSATWIRWRICYRKTITKNKIQNQIITKYFQSIKKHIKATIPVNALYTRSISPFLPMPFKIQEIVFILPVIPFQNSRCLRLVGEYPVIPFQIQSGYVLKDEKWERRVSCHYLSNSRCLQLFFALILSPPFKFQTLTTIGIRQASMIFLSPPFSHHWIERL